MRKKASHSYNERLFSGGIRKKLHFARYQWLAARLHDLECQTDSVLELGCYDGKVINFLPKSPSHYVGLDADWEGGLEIAKSLWQGQDNFQFLQCSHPNEMPMFRDQEFDISICMETLEHVPPSLVSPYLERMAQCTKHLLFITVPNEIGIVFLFKHLVKRLFGDSDVYSYREFVCECLGKTQYVKRNEHKGFNYHRLETEIERYFDIIELSGHPLSYAPPCLNFGIGIIAKPKLIS